MIQIIIIITLLSETAYNIRIPGFGTDEVRGAGAKKQAGSSSTHQQRLNQVKKAIALDSSERERVDRTRISIAKTKK